MPRALSGILEPSSRESKPKEQDEAFHNCTSITRSEISEELYFIKAPYLYKTLMRSHYDLQYPHL